MQPSPLILFANSRPFEPFRIFIADGRIIDVKHPEMLMVGEHAMVLWILHFNGQIEVLDGSLISALETLGSVDPRAFLGPANNPE